MRRDKAIGNSRPWRRRRACVPGSAAILAAFSGGAGGDVEDGSIEVIDPGGVEDEGYEEYKVDLEQLLENLHQAMEPDPAALDPHGRSLPRSPFDILIAYSPRNFELEWALLAGMCKIYIDAIGKYGEALWDLDLEWDSDALNFSATFEVWNELKDDIAAELLAVAMARISILQLTMQLSGMPVPAYDIRSVVRMVHRHTAECFAPDEVDVEAYLRARASGFVGPLDMGDGGSSQGDTRSWWQKAVDAVVGAFTSAVKWVQDKLAAVGAWIQAKIDIGGRAIFGDAWTRMRAVVNFQNPIIRGAIEVAGWALALLEPTPFGEMLMGGFTLFRIGKLAKLGKIAWMAGNRLLYKGGVQVLKGFNTVTKALGFSLKTRAIWAIRGRNLIRSLTRLLGPPALRRALNLRAPNIPPGCQALKYYNRGFRGNALWEELIYKSTYTNPDVDYYCLHWFWYWWIR